MAGKSIVLFFSILCQKIEFSRFWAEKNRFFFRFWPKKIVLFRFWAENLIFFVLDFGLNFFLFSIPSHKVDYVFLLWVKKSILLFDSGLKTRLIVSITGRKIDFFFRFGVENRILFFDSGTKKIDFFDYGTKNSILC